MSRRGLGSNRHREEADKMAEGSRAQGGWQWHKGVTGAQSRWGRAFLPMEFGLLSAVSAAAGKEIWGSLCLTGWQEGEVGQRDCSGDMRQPPAPKLAWCCLRYGRGGLRCRTCRFTRDQGQTGPLCASSGRGEDSSVVTSEHKPDAGIVHAIKDLLCASCPASSEHMLAL